MKRKPLKSKPVDQKAAAKRAALNALKRARRLAERSEEPLTEWEAEFLGSVEERVETYGRAFGDPAKGGAGQALSDRQGAKLKQIAKKARGKAKEIETVEAVLVEDANDDEDG